MKETERERAKQKEQLRRGMTVTPEKDELDMKLFRHRLLRGLLVTIILLLVAGGVMLFMMHLNNQNYVGHNVSWEKDVMTTDRDKFLAYGEFVLRYNRNGIAYINGNGETAWSQSYEMTDPVAVVGGKYIAVFDRGGYKMYICNANGSTGSIKTILPIQKATISDAGVAVIAVQDDLADKVYFYDSTGRQIDIEMMTLLTEDGYTLDMSLSPDGKQLVSAYVYLDQGAMKNQVVFRNFGEEGQEMIKRLVGGFKEYESQLIGRTVFLTDVYACAFAQDRICFYTLKNRLSPQLAKQIDYSEEIASVFYTSEYVGVISEGSNSVQKKVTVYEPNGDKVTEFETDFAYTGANFSGGRIVLYNSMRCEIYDLDGELKYAANVGTDIRWLSCPTGESILVLDGSSVSEIVLEKKDTWTDLWN